MKKQNSDVPSHIYQTIQHFSNVHVLYLIYRGRPTISIISARPMDQSSSFPSVQFKDNKAEVTTQEGNDNNNQQSASAEVTVQVPKRPPDLNKPSKPAPYAPKKPPPKPGDKSAKPADTSKKKAAPMPNLRSKTKTSKRDSGSVFYVDTSADSAMDTKSSSTTSNSSNETAQKPKQVPSQPSVRSKPTLPAPRKSRAIDEQKASEVDPVASAKVKPPDKAASKPKLKPTIITAKTPKQQSKAENDVKISKNVITPDASKTADDDDRPSRPSFPPTATTDEINKNENQPERPKAPPNTIKEEQKHVEMKREQKNVQSEKKRPKSKPARPPIGKESARPKPSRPPPAKPNVTRYTFHSILIFIKYIYRNNLLFAFYLEQCGSSHVSVLIR